MQSATYSTAYSSIQGAARGCITNVYDKTDEQNDRLMQRWSDQIDPIIPDLSVRAQYTKYSQFHVYDVNLLNLPNLGNVATGHSAFHPGSQHGHTAKYRATVDLESQLQNRGLVALQKNDIGVYVPQVDGPLYQPNTIESFVPISTAGSLSSSRAGFAKQLQDRHQSSGRQGTKRMFNLDSHAKNN